MTGLSTFLPRESRSRELGACDPSFALGRVGQLRQIFWFSIHHIQKVQNFLGFFAAEPINRARVSGRMASEKPCDLGPMLYYLRKLLF